MSRPPATQYSIHLRVSLSNVPGVLGSLATAIGNAGGNIYAVDSFVAKGTQVDRDIVVNCKSVEHQSEVVEAVRNTPGITLHDWWDRTFRMHEGGKIEVLSLCPVGDQEDLSMAYTPGVARVCNAIAADESLADEYTIRKNTVAIVSDGTAVLGLGNIGPKGAMPVMEGKALLFKEFGGVDAWPIVLDTKDPDEIIRIVKAIAPGFGGINLEDISAPRCFYIEDTLRAELDIPVFHDDQHGTAVVVLAGLINALKIIRKKPADLKVVVAGVGAAGTACTKILMSYGVTDIVGYDRQGALSVGRDYGDNVAKKWFADNTNPRNFTGSLADGLVGADFLLGLAGPGLVNTEMVSKMGKDAIVFALSNPDPEIWPEEVPDNVRIMATGRSDYPNQVNNSLCFPGLFRGVLDVRAREINDEMKIAAAQAIANVIPEGHLSEDFIMPSVFETRVARDVTREVARAAQRTGVARRARRGRDEIYATRRLR
jgi:malate dehydrogenase (oxaloacetate-decarboxylating)